jgi:hypothetical protein
MSNETARFEEKLARAKEVLTDDTRKVLHAAAARTVLVASLYDTPEELEKFFRECFTALYNDARKHAGKSYGEKPDMASHVRALQITTGLGVAPEAAVFGAFMAVYAEGYDS